MKNLLGTVAQAAVDGPVRIIHLKIGELAGISTDALDFAFEVLSKGTVAEGGKLEFENIPLRIRCAGCGAESHPDSLIFICTECGGSNIEILSGREMEVDYIVVDDEEPGN